MPTGTQTPSLAASPPREVEDRDPIYLKVRDLVYQACGIYHSEEKLYLLSGACKRRMTHAKAKDPRQYLDLISSPSTRALELRELLNELTIGGTVLFRSEPQRPPCET